MLFAVPAPASAALTVAINPASSSDRIYEEERLNLTAYPDSETARVVVTFGPAGPACAAEPGGDPRPVVADGQADVGLDTTATAPEPGSYRACAWEYDGAGAIAGRGEKVAEVLEQFAEATVSAFPPRVWRGIPLDVFAGGLGMKGRIMQTAILRTACPPTAPAEADPAVVAWVGGFAGRTLGSDEVDVRLRVTLMVAGTYRVCNWISERLGDPGPEARAEGSFTIVGGKARTVVGGLRAIRDRSDASKPVRWNAVVVGAFRGRVFLEARKVVHAGLKLRGSGPWKRVATVNLARRPLRSGGGRGLAGSSYLRVSGATVLPASIGTQCGGQSRIAQIRVRFPGTKIARPARSEVVELIGSLGGC